MTDWSDAPCRVWTGATARGYGHVWHQGKVWSVHRLEWTRANGPIPPGVSVLHHCDNPPCYEITHLFLGTNIDNMRDMVSKGRHGRPYAKRTHCPHGHEYTPENTYVNRRGHRICRACGRERCAKYDAAHPDRLHHRTRRTLDVVGVDGVPEVPRPEGGGDLGRLRVTPNEGNDPSGGGGRHGGVHD